jgi:hypothetical protein
MTFTQIQLETGIPATSVRDLVGRGLLPFVRFDGSRRIWIRRTDVQRLIETSTERAS